MPEKKYKHPTQQGKAEAHCFAHRRGSCRVMSSGVCAGVCSFYRTKKDLRRARSTAAKRLCALPEIRQRDIAETYFEGERPWVREMRL